MYDHANLIACQLVQLFPQPFLDIVLQLSPLYTQKMPTGFSATADDFSNIFSDRAGQSSDDADVLADVCCLYFVHSFRTR